MRIISRSAAACSFLLCCVCLLLEGQALAQYPLLPPETVGNANYQWRPDLGGWLDVQNKLVWGYGFTESTGSNTSYAGAQTAGSRYASGMASQSAWCTTQAEYCEAQAIAYQTSDPARSAAYASLAVSYRASASAFLLASADAAQFTNWRSPTSREFITAWNRGLFSRGAGAFNMDMSPAQGYDSGGQNLNWTSDPLTKNKKLANVFSLSNGAVSTTGVNSSLNAQMVRTYVP